MGASVQIDGLKEVIEDIMKDRLRDGASKIADDLTRCAEHSILSFYDHYQPRRYRRQGGLRGSYIRYYKNPHNKIYYGGVEIQPGNGFYLGKSGGKIVDVSAEWITALAVFNGMHGNVEAFPSPWRPKNIPPRMSPSPYEIIEKKRDEILNNIDSYVN